MSLKGINAKIKNSLNGAKITNNSLQKISTVSDKDRDALQVRKNNLLERLNNAEDAIDSLRLNIIGSGNRGNSGNRVELDPGLKQAFGEIISEIKLSKERIYKAAQINPRQRNGSLPKAGLSKEQYNDLKKELDSIDSDIRSSLQMTKKIIEDLSKS